MKHLVEWLHRIRLSRESERSPHIARMFHAGHLRPAAFTKNLSIQPLGRLPVRPGDTGPESVAVLQFPDVLPLSERTLMLAEEIGALFCLVTRRRTAVPLELPISVKGSNTINFLPYGGGIDRELIGPLPDDALIRLSRALTSVGALTPDDTAMLGAATKLHYGACLLVERDVRSAYVLLVAALEVLSRKYGVPPREWSAWEDSSGWDSVFSQLTLNQDQQEVLRQKLLDNRHLRLKRTFCEYAANAIPTTFWDLAWEQWSYTYHVKEECWSEATPAPIPVAEIIPRDRAVLRRALAKSYDIRSLYVHRGDEFDVAGSLRQLDMPLTGDQPLPYQFLRLIVGELILHELRRVTSEGPSESKQ